MRYEFCPGIIVRSVMGKQNHCHSSPIVVQEGLIFQVAKIIFNLHSFKSVVHKGLNFFLVICTRFSSVSLLTSGITFMIFSNDFFSWSWFRLVSQEVSKISALIYKASTMFPSRCLFLLMWPQRVSEETTPLMSQHFLKRECTAQKIAWNQVLNM